MKKLFLFLAVVILMFSFGCSNDDDNTPKQDLIIGVWKTVKDVEIYKNGNEEVYFPSACEAKNRYTFRTDGTFITTDFPESDDANCEELVGNLYLSGTWVKVATSIYQFTYKCYIPACVDETITEAPDNVTFSNDNKTMIVRFNEDDPEDLVDYYYTELVRVQ